ncbi:GNAT family N-acetyltransferase [Saccharibacillus alkalitolerans]|uniref:GNAT family N-acetyltransferase n=1 Tax=Saccharibacillus alkalitolerans TaxID=2705290 RepID=A0ABX0F7W6_9BACL|nr:GNAT family N-acetyltransferase [Saccharibacillus alkalitolerans]NGZ76937.1 GNAT family N-acetyltransferase [Saccharibacillus alkalitolerans]
MEWSIREARAEDLPDLKKLCWELDTDAVFYQPKRFVLAERPDEFLLSIIEGSDSGILAAEGEEGVVGFSLLQEKATPPISCLLEKRYVYVLELIVSEKHRSEGIGALLLEASKQWGRQRGLDFLRLSVFEENVRGIAFYEKNGLAAAMKTMECEL